MVSATARPPCHLGLVVSVPFQCLVHGRHAPRGVGWLGGVGRTCRPGMSLGHLPPLPSGDSSGATRAQAQDTPPLPAQLLRDPSQARQCFLNRLFISEQLDFQKCCRGSPGTLRATPVLPFRALTLVRTRPPPLPVAGDRPPDLTRMVPVFLAAPGSTPGSHGALAARAPPACARLSASGVPARSPAGSPPCQRPVVFLAEEHSGGKRRGLPAPWGVRNTHASPARPGARLPLVPTSSDQFSFPRSAHKVWASVGEGAAHLHLLQGGRPHMPPATCQGDLALVSVGADACAPAPRPRSVFPASEPGRCRAPETRPSFALPSLLEPQDAAGSSCIFSAQPCNELFLQEPWFMRITLTLENAAQVFWNRDRLAERLSSFSHCPALIPGHSAAQDTRPTRLPTPRCSPLYRLCRCCWPRGDLRAHQLAVRPTHRQTNPNPAGIRGLHALT